MPHVIITQEGDPTGPTTYYCPKLGNAFFISREKLTKYAVFSLYLTGDPLNPPEKQETAPILKFTFNESKLYDRCFLPMSGARSKLWANMGNVHTLEWASFDQNLSGGFRLICHMDKNKIDTHCFDFFFN